LSSQTRFWTIFLLPFFGLAAFVAGYFFGVSFTSDFLGDCRLPPLFVTAVNFKPFDNSLLRLYSSFWRLSLLTTLGALFGNLLLPQPAASSGHCRLRHNYSPCFNSSITPSLETRTRYEALLRHRLDAVKPCHWLCTWSWHVCTR
jgi:hypothetical protein